MIEWCEDLDFDKYCESWHTMATSAKPSLPSDDNNVQVYGLGLGDITIGLGQAPMAASQQLPGSLGMSELGGNAAINNTYMSTQGNLEPRQVSRLSGKMAGATENSAKKQQDALMYMEAQGGSPAQNAFLASKAKEDVFLKDNLEYEQRLKTHLYQFED